MIELFSHSEDSDQMPHSAASDMGLHCLLKINTLLGVSRLQWVKNKKKYEWQTVENLMRCLIVIACYLNCILFEKVSGFAEGLNL